MDVEAAEVDVLAGAAETIRSYGPILLIELHGTNAPVAAALETLGYCGAVLSDGKSLVKSHWNAHVIAASQEKIALVQSVVKVCSSGQ